jgi:hypothetical protein
MRRTTLVAVLLASLAFSARANDGIDLSLRTKALASAGSIREASTSASSAGDTMPPLPMMGETEQLGVRNNGCANRDVCYDYVSGHIVVRPAREYMPRMNGLTPENLSVRHNRVTFTYSFK